MNSAATAATKRPTEITEQQACDAVDAYMTRALNGGPVVWAELLALFTIAEEKSHRAARTIAAEVSQ